MLPSAPLQIGALAKLTGATPKALRLYEELGLLPSPARRGRYRVYGQLHLDTVHLIRQAQALGFRLRELQNLARQAPLVEALGIALARQLVARKRAAVAEQLRALEQQLQALQAFEQQLDQAHELACLCPQLGSA